MNERSFIVNCHTRQAARLPPWTGLAAVAAPNSEEAVTLRPIAADTAARTVLHLTSTLQRLPRGSLSCEGRLGVELCFVKLELRGVSVEAKKLLRDFPPNRRYLIGVSGGRDSVTLLHWLVALGYKKLITCHLNHQLRGQASEADVRFVEKLSAKYDVDFELGSTNVRTLAAEAKMSLETAARAARYSFFAKVAKQRRSRTVFIGHHADDLVETFLINLFRGAGTAGLSAMREMSTRRIDAVELTVVRPLLGVWRTQIDDYVREHRLKFREDASNRDLAPMRNRLRLRVIPYLEKALGRNVRVNICRAANIAAEEENFFDALLPEELSKLASLAVRPLRAMPIAVQRRMLHEWLRAGDVGGVSFDLVERIRALLDLARGVSKTNLPQDRHVRRRAGALFIDS